MSGAVTSTIPLLAYAAPKVNGAGEVVVMLRASGRVVRLVGPRAVWESLARAILGNTKRGTRNAVSSAAAGLPLKASAQNAGAEAPPSFPNPHSAIRIRSNRTPEYRAAVLRAVARVKAGERPAAAARAEGVNYSTISSALYEERTGRAAVKSTRLAETLAKYRRVIARVAAGETLAQAAWGEGAKLDNVRVWWSQQKKKTAAAAAAGGPILKPSGELL